MSEKSLQNKAFSGFLARKGRGLVPSRAAKEKSNKKARTVGFGCIVLSIQDAKMEIAANMSTRTDSFASMHSELSTSFGFW